MAKILIAGCGAIGRELGNALAAAGHQVTGLKRSPPVVNPDNFAYLRADLIIAADLAQLDDDFDFVFYILSPDGRSLESYLEVYKRGLDNLAKRLPRAVWFFVSSTSVYGQTGGEWIDEDSATLGSGDTSRLILAAENTVRCLNPQNVIVRFSGIYGPGREYLLRQAKENPVVQQTPPYYTNRIHQSDCVAILAFLLGRKLAGTALSSCYLASDDEPASLWDVMTWLTGQLGLPPPAAKPFSTDASMNKRCRNKRLTNLGYQMLYPSFRQGYSEMICAKAPEIHI